MNKNDKTNALAEETLEQVVGGFITTDPMFDQITGLLTQWGNLAWTLGAWNGLWRAINEAEKVAHNDVTTRAQKIKDALAIIVDYQSQLGSNYSEMKSSLEYCLKMTENS